MWRRYGDVPYTLLVFAVFSLEVLSLAFVTWSFSRHLFGFVPYKEAQGVLVGGMAVTAAVLAMLTGYILAYHAMSLSRDRRSRQRIQMWTERWIKALFGEGPFPQAPLSREAQEAALSLRELLGGDEGMELAARLESAGVGQSLVRRLGSRRHTVRLQALEALARARLPTAFAAVNHLLNHPQPAVRLMAGRAAARTIATWNGPAREAGVISFADSLGRADLPAGVVTEVLILLQDAAAAVIARLMADPNLSALTTRACLDAVGRLGLVQLAYEVGSRTTHTDAEVRAAALRAGPSSPCPGQGPRRGRHRVGGRHRVRQDPGRPGCRVRPGGECRHGPVRVVERPVLVGSPGLSRIPARSRRVGSELPAEGRDFSSGPLCEGYGCPGVARRGLRGP